MHALCFVLWVVLALVQQGKGAQPNILFILTDDQSLDTLPYMPKVHKHLTMQGVQLPNYFIPTPLCAPSRASILRGQYAHNTGIIDLSLPGGGALKYHNTGRENSTIGTWLQGAGYRTALFGKYMNQYPCNQSNPSAWVPSGWDDWFALCDPFVYDYFNSAYSENGKVVHYSGDYQTNTLGQRALDYINDTVATGQPFFLYLAFVAPHEPATPAVKYRTTFSNLDLPKPPSYNQTDVSKMPSFISSLQPFSEADEKTQLTLYLDRLRCLQSVDDWVEAIVLQLQQLGVYDNTYIVYTADNGFHLGEHRLGLGKREPYEEDIRVPFIISGPGIPANGTSLINANNIDIAPTLAAMAGIEPPSFMDGKSILSHVKNTKSGDYGRMRADQDTFRPLVLIEHWGVSSGGVGQQVYINNTWQGIRVLNSTTDLLYTSWCTSQHEIYHMTGDPYQLDNTFDVQATKAYDVQFLDATLRAYFQCGNVSCQNLPDVSPKYLPVPLRNCFINTGSGSDRTHQSFVVSVV